MRAFAVAVAVLTLGSACQSGVTIAPKLAKDQVRAAEQQTIFGIIPNFYTVYDKNAVPLSSKLKFQLALKYSTEPVTIVGVGFLAGVYQAIDLPAYPLGASLRSTRTASRTS